MAIFDLFGNGGLLGGSGGTGGGLLGGNNPFSDKSNMLALMGLGLLSGKDWQDGMKNAASGMISGKGLDTSQVERRSQAKAIEAMTAENKLTPAQQQLFAAYPELGAKYAMAKMQPEAPTFGVIGEDEYGAKKYGWISPASRSVTPIDGGQTSPQAPQQVVQGPAYQPGQTATAPMPQAGGMAPTQQGAIPQAPAGVDPRLWRQEQTRSLIERSKLARDAEARRTEASQIGLQPDDPRYQSYVLTGKLPREDAQPLTATDKKAILEADESVSTNQAAIQAMQQAKQISPQANAGWGASTRAALANNLPDWMVPNAVSSPESGLATTDLENLVTGSGLSQLKSIFGAAPTEGERKILMELQGSANLPDEARQKIYDRAIIAANRRLRFNRERAEGLRGNTYYKPGGSKSTADGPSVDDLLKKYGVE